MYVINIGSKEEEAKTTTAKTTVAKVRVAKLTWRQDFKRDNGLCDVMTYSLDKP